MLRSRSEIGSTMLNPLHKVTPERGNWSNVFNTVILLLVSYSSSSSKLAWVSQTLVLHVEA